MIAGDGDGRPSLELLAGQLGVRDSVRFVGHVPDDDLPDLYRAADLFVMPSTGEGFGIVFLQAMASGIPVIGGDGDGGRDPLRDGRDGALVSSREPCAVARAIGRELRPDRGECSPERPFERARFQGFVARILEGSRSGAPAEVRGPAMSGRAPP